MSIERNLEKILKEIENYPTQLVAVSKTKPHSDILTIYKTGFNVFGENKVQELSSKQELLPKDIEWHMIGHLQSNKVKYIAPFVSLIHGIDSLKLLKEINKQGQKNNRIINCLLQVHIARETTKFGLDFKEIETILQSDDVKNLQNIHIKGLMGMATFTDNAATVRGEFKSLRKYFENIQSIKSENISIKELSMGMSGDYQIAIEEGSTLIRVGSSIFGERN